MRSRKLIQLLKEKRFSDTRGHDIESGSDIFECVVSRIGSLEISDVSQCPKQPAYKMERSRTAQYRLAIVKRNQLHEEIVGFRQPARRNQVARVTREDVDDLVGPCAFVHQRPDDGAAHPDRGLPEILPANLDV